MEVRLFKEFFTRDVLEVAPDLLGKNIARDFGNGIRKRFLITEVEAYRGISDLACHASKGRTPRTEVMFQEGGKIYVYLIYGMYWMLNIVTGQEGDASAVLIRGLNGISGPGKVGKVLELNKSFYGMELATSDRIWIEEGLINCRFDITPRIGIHYAGEPWISKPWRFILRNSDLS